MLARRFSPYTFFPQRLDLDNLPVSLPEMSLSTR
jgi:hypothetical protein